MADGLSFTARMVGKTMVLDHKSGGCEPATLTERELIAARQADEALMREAMEALEECMPWMDMNYERSEAAGHRGAMIAAKLKERLQ